MGELNAAAERSGPLQKAFDAVRGLEAVLNARAPDGMYLSQIEGVVSFADRLTPYVAAEYLGVSGLGSTTDFFGYQPTQHGPSEYAASVIAFRELGILADLAAGGDGTNDWIHTPIRGSVSGNTAHFVLNFAHFGSLTDDHGNRLPSVIPNSWVGLPGDGSVPITGRCICTCERVKGVWKLTSFYFVLTPPEMLFAE